MKLTKEERDAIKKWDKLVNILINTIDSKPDCKIIKLHKDKK